MSKWIEVKFYEIIRIGFGNIAAFLFVCSLNIMFLFVIIEMILIFPVFLLALADSAMGNLFFDGFEIATKQMMMITVPIVVLLSFLFAPKMTISMHPHLLKPEEE